VASSVSASSSGLVGAVLGSCVASSFEGDGASAWSLPHPATSTRVIAAAAVRREFLCERFGMASLRFLGCFYQPRREALPYDSRPGWHATGLVVCRSELRSLCQAPLFECECNRLAYVL